MLDQICKTLEKNLANNHMENEIKNIEDKCRKELMKGLGVEERIPAQKAKITLLKIGDGINRYFHANVREKKNKSTQIKKLEKRMAQ